MKRICTILLPPDITKVLDSTKESSESIHNVSLLLTSGKILKNRKILNKEVLLSDTDEDLSFKDIKEIIV